MELIAAVDREWAIGRERSCCSPFRRTWPGSKRLPWAKPSCMAAEPWPPSPAENPAGADQLCTHPSSRADSGPGPGILPPCGDTVGGGPAGAGTFVVGASRSMSSCYPGAGGLDYPD